jgi:hypothetical protein
VEDPSEKKALMMRSFMAYSIFNGLKATNWGDTEIAYADNLEEQS